MAAARRATHDVLVVGAGNASGYLLRSLADIMGGTIAKDVLMIGDEPHLPYERPALSKGYLMKGGFPVPNFATCAGEGKDKQDGEWYEANGFPAPKLGARVVSIDSRAKKVKLSTGEELEYRKACVVATGARAIRAGEVGVDVAEDASGLYHLRDVADFDHLLGSIKSGSAKRCVVVGGGYIGTEVAAALTEHDPVEKVSICYMEDNLMARILPPSVSKLYAGRFAARGVDLVQGVVTKVSTNAIGKVCGVELRDGSSIEADAVVVGIGARANTALLEGVEGVELAAGGVAVDAGMRTGAAQSSIFAIGDIAAFPGALGSAPGELRRFEHVDCARKTAARCAESLAALLGGAGDSKNRSAFEYLPYCYSRILGCDWAIYGSRGADDRLELLSGDVSSSSPFQLFWVNPSTSVVTAALLDGCSDEDKAAARTAVETGAKWPLKAPSRM